RGGKRAVPGGPWGFAGGRPAGRDLYPPFLHPLLGSSAGFTTLQPQQTLIFFLPLPLQPTDQVASARRSVRAITRFGSKTAPRALFSMVSISFLRPYQSLRLRC